MAGRLDSNQRMARSKPAALPLGDAPKFDDQVKWQGRLDSNQRMADQNPLPLPLGDALLHTSTGEIGRGGWIRTNGWRDQNPLPYHLATPLIGNLKMP